ncbi:hypothetical protein RRG08_021120 [Elysia crispata]|uniref:Uncharacterized protein n=1 Tax=Elysia crispata TaxID=231223 RepID=A0AAE0Z5Q3_9GAST|nr:hypothetical protein RRG08_021120 [Elysia crispata]
MPSSSYSLEPRIMRMELAVSRFPLRHLPSSSALGQPVPDLGTSGARRARPKINTRHNVAASLLSLHATDTEESALQNRSSSSSFLSFSPELSALFLETSTIFHALRSFSYCIY